MLTLKGKITLLKQLRAARRVDIAETIVRVDAEPDQPAQMEIDSELESESDEDVEDEIEDDQEHEQLDEDNDDEAPEDEELLDENE